MPRASRSPESERVVALVGCSGLLGGEVKDRLSEGPLASARVRLFEAGEGANVLTGFGDEPALATALAADSFDDADVVLLACAPGDAERALALPRRAEALVVSLVAGSGGPEAPAVNLEVNGEALPGHRGIVEAAAPLPLLLTSLLASIDRAAGVRRASAVAFEPASGIGRGAMDELHKQTLDLMSFTSGPRDTYGRQIAFNLLPLSLAPAAGGAGREEALARQASRILGWDSGRLALKVILAPVFHGHAVALHVETDRSIDTASLRSSFGSDRFDASDEGGEDAPSTPAEWAGEERIRIAEVAGVAGGAGAGGDGKGGWWIWAFCDDLKSGAAANAVKIAESLSGL